VTIVDPIIHPSPGAIRTVSGDSTEPPPSATRCLEVALVGNGALSVLSLPESWELVSSAAEAVQRVAPLDRWGELSALYRVEPVAGRTRHYVVAEG
jgi:hypothetical protein